MVEHILCIQNPQLSVMGEICLTCVRAAEKRNTGLQPAAQVCGWVVASFL